MRRVAQGETGIGRRDFALDGAGGDEFERVDRHPVRRGGFRGNAYAGVVGVGGVAGEVARHQSRGARRTLARCVGFIALKAKS